MTKVLLITGASSGIGRTTAVSAAKQGYQVILTARRKALLDELVADIGTDKAIGIAADVTDYKSLEQAVVKGVDKFGRLDAVFANAGTGVSTAGSEEGEPEEWSTMVDINIKGLLYTARLTLPHLRKTTGHFLMTGSA